MNLNRANRVSYFIERTEAKVQGYRAKIHETQYGKCKFHLYFFALYFIASLVCVISLLNYSCSMQFNHHGDWR